MRGPLRRWPVFSVRSSLRGRALWLGGPLPVWRRGGPVLRSHYRCRLPGLGGFLDDVIAGEDSGTEFPAVFVGVDGFFGNGSDRSLGRWSASARPAGVLACRPGRGFRCAYRESEMSQAEAYYP